MGSPDHSPAADLLLEVVPRLMQIISSEAQSGVSSTGLTYTQVRVLGKLVGGRRLPSEVARDLRITPATVSEVVELLARRGMVERRDDPEDRRVSVLVATPAGVEAWRSARSRALAALEALVSRLGPGEARALELGLRSVLFTVAPDAAAQHEEANAG